MVDKADRSLHDALSVLSQTVKETRIFLGGGCSEMLMANRVDEVAKKAQGKKALAVEAFAKALRQMPTILADNAGLDSSDLVARLRAAHCEGKFDSGLGAFSFPSVVRSLLTSGTDHFEGTIASMAQLGVTESYKLKRQVVLSASEASEMVLQRGQRPSCAAEAERGAVDGHRAQPDLQVMTRLLCSL
jgi:T-complex protein 1 subunit beta